MKLRMILILVALLGLSTAANAAADDDAAKWLERVFALVEDRAIRTDYVIIVSGEAEGMLVDAKLQGELLQAGPKHYTNTLAMEVKTPAMGETPMEITSQQVSDGETLWTETYVSAMGITQIGKISLADLDEIIASKEGLNVGQTSMYMDPMSQLAMIVEAFDISVLKIADGEVSLSMLPTEVTSGQFGDLGDGELTGVLVLREEDAVPLSVTVTVGTTMNIDMRFEGFELMSLGDVPVDAFIYTPAADAEVVDMAPMLRAGM